MSKKSVSSWISPSWSSKQTTTKPAPSQSLCTEKTSMVGQAFGASIAHTIPAYKLGYSGPEVLMGKHLSDARTNSSLFDPAPAQSRVSSSASTRYCQTHMWTVPGPGRPINTDYWQVGDGYRNMGNTGGEGDVKNFSNW